VIDGTGHLRNDAARITELVASDLDVAVPSCPGWSLRDLVTHLGGVHRWATAAVKGAARPDTNPAAEAGAAPEEPDALARWFGDGAIALANALDAAAPDAPTWTPFLVPDPTVSVWLRRQTQETALHRWDAESAVGAARELDPVVAADGIDEYLGVFVPRRVQLDGLVLPSGRAHLHCTDVPGEWTVEVVDGDYVIDRTHRKGDAAIRGTAEHLFLALWGRSVPDGAIDVFGDEAVADAWLSLGGV